MEEYKALNDIDDNVIYLMNESLKISYIDAAEFNAKETAEHVDWFRKVYLMIIKDIVLIAICFVMIVIF